MRLVDERREGLEAVFVSLDKIKEAEPAMPRKLRRRLNELQELLDNVSGQERLAWTDIAFFLEEALPMVQQAGRAELWTAYLALTQVYANRM